MLGPTRPHAHPKFISAEAVMPQCLLSLRSQWLTSLPSPALRPYLSSGCQSSSSLPPPRRCLPGWERPLPACGFCLSLTTCFPIRVTQSVPCNKWPHPVIRFTCVYLSKAMVAVSPRPGVTFYQLLCGRLLPCSRSHALSVFLNQRAPNLPSMRLASLLRETSVAV